MPHHKHPDEGGLDFGTLEFDDETGTEITVTISGKTTADPPVDLGPDQLVLSSSTSEKSWTPPSGETWEDVGELSVTKLYSGQPQVTVTASSDDGTPIKSATCNIDSAGNCTLTARDGSGTTLGTGTGLFPLAVQFSTMRFENAHDTVYVDVTTVAVNQRPSTWQNAVPSGTNDFAVPVAQWDVHWLDVTVYSDAARTQMTGNAGAQGYPGGPSFATATFHIEPAPGNWLALDVYDKAGNHVPFEALSTD